MRVEILPYGENFIYLLHDNGVAAVIDPPADLPVLRALQANRLDLQWIIVTHHHGDHVGGCAALKRQTGAIVLGPNDSRILTLDRPVHDGDRIDVCGTTLRVLATPGHTRTHVAYYAEELRSVWTGDAVFVAGCGRILEGSAREMLQSMRRIAALPPQTRLYCGHDYTIENLEFALRYEPGNPDSAAKLARMRQALATGALTVPSSVEEELLTNLFMRTDSPVIREMLKLQDAPAVDVLAALRRLKDAW